MKKNILSFLAGIVLVSLFAFLPKEEKDKSLARVPRTQGKYVFFRCEPVEEYDVVFDFTIVTWDGAIEDVANGGVRRANEKSKNKKLDYDAIIIGSGIKDIAIKFK